MCVRSSTERWRVLNIVIVAEVFAWIIHAAIREVVIQEHNRSREPRKQKKRKPMSISFKSMP